MFICLSFAVKLTTFKNLVKVETEYMYIKQLVFEQSEIKLAGLESDESVLNHVAVNTGLHSSMQIQGQELVKCFWFVS